MKNYLAKQKRIGGTNKGITLYHLENPATADPLGLSVMATLK